MKPSAGKRQARGEAKKTRRRQRKMKAPGPVKSHCPKCRHKTPDLDTGGFVRCSVCGGVKR